MKLPFDRECMRERDLLDDIDEIELARSRTPEERFIAALELGDRALDLCDGDPDAPVIDWHEDLEEKARLWAAPLRVIKRA